MLVEVPDLRYLYFRNRNDVSSMRQDTEPLLRTRASLIRRLRNWQDQTSWQDFFNLYWKLIYGLARKSGLTDDEAQDAVQETLISVARHMPTFRYDPAIGSFKAWLCNMARWRIIAQFRKRRSSNKCAPLPVNSSNRTDVLERFPDPGADAFQSDWDAEWKTNLLNAATTNVRRRLTPEKYRIFDVYVNREWPPEKIAERFGVSPNQVYKIKHRVTKAIRNEVRRLEQKMV
jgi:RNA polymerase sigma factor (sigma-70 family)